MEDIEPIREITKSSYQRKQEKEKKLALIILGMFQQQELTIREAKEVLEVFEEMINDQLLSQSHQNN